MLYRLLYRLPCALAAVKGQARYRDSLWSPLTVTSLPECSGSEGRGSLCACIISTWLVPDHLPDNCWILPLFNIAHRVQIERW
jgi:hypothetical protein